MKKEIPSITTDRLLLRTITESDLENIYYGLSNPDVIKHYGISYDSLEATNEQMTWFSDSKQFWWAICSIDNGTFYGACGLNNLSIEHRKAEIGLWLLPDFWGQGIMTEAMPLICSYGFEQLELHRIEGFVESDNQNCKKAMAKLDFQHEGTMKDSEIKNGRFISIDIYAKLKTV
ncbi:GNAT family N-acetyltransferase [Confluentibacter flavum]|uniref:GNAT family N-acetyltransferase n=1 Tax=Confluentibacter flavum TaxID=1909700 RepID=A0A2N3HPI0_9FLAO|nr:GNAT family protein [Confluentibacter flavum]PKQ46855.1 GNAT family N-acetyltransferase [Confluentibacter flavum]